MSNIYSTNQRDPDADTEEAQRLLAVISDADFDDLTEWEQGFIESITERLKQGWRVTEKQLYKLRDITDGLL